MYAYILSHPKQTHPHRPQWVHACILDVLPVCVRSSSVAVMVGTYTWLCTRRTCGRWLKHHHPRCNPTMRYTTTSEVSQNVSGFSSASSWTPLCELDRHPFCFDYISSFSLTICTPEVNYKQGARRRKVSLARWTQRWASAWLWSAATLGARLCF